MIPRRREFRLYGPRKSTARRVLSLVFFLVVLFLAYLVVSGFLIRTVAVGSSSMEPTVAPGDRLFVTPLVYGPVVPFTDTTIRPLVSPRRGELVLVRPPYYRSTPFLEVVSPVVAFFTLQKIRLHAGPGDSERIELVRRVVGLPGDTVRIEGFTASVRPIGGARFEGELELSRRAYTITFDPLPPGWDESMPFSDAPREFQLGDDEYFLMSDDRSFTNDSRYWGPVGIGAITGKVLLRYWPLPDFGVPR